MAMSTHSPIECASSDVSFRDAETGRWKFMTQAKRVKEIRKAMGLSLEQLAALFTDPPISRAGVNKWELGGGISDKHLNQLAKISGYRKSWIIDGDLPKKIAQPNIEDKLTQGGTPPILPVSPGARDLPILGGAKGGADGVFLDNGTHFGMTERPPSVTGVPSAYAVEIYEDSMAPRFEPGETVPVHPHRTVVQGDDCVVQIGPEEDGGDIHYLVKRFVSRNADHLVLEQFNPAKKLKFQSDRVIAVHKIPRRGEH